MACCVSLHRSPGAGCRCARQANPAGEQMAPRAVHQKLGPAALFVQCCLCVDCFEEALHGAGRHRKCSTVGCVLESQAGWAGPNCCCEAAATALKQLHYCIPGAHTCLKHLPAQHGLTPVAQCSYPSKASMMQHVSAAHGHNVCWQPQPPACGHKTVHEGYAA